MAGLVILSLGLAPLFTLAADLAIGAAPPERAGAASGISETSSELGGALGLAILGTVGTAVYRAQAPAEAGDTLAGAPQSLAFDVLENARAAFTEGLQVAATLSGLLLVVAAVLVARLVARERVAVPVRVAVESPC